MKNESTTLYFKRGSTDKVYSVQLNQTDARNWVVTFAFGRRGKAMKTGVKTKEPMTYEAAKPIYDKLIHAKQLKGYTTDGEDIAFADNPNAGEDTGFRPQLLNEIDMTEAKIFYLANVGNVAMQIKWDGERRAAILKMDRDNTFTNRKGQVKGVIATIDTACRILVQDRPLVTDLELDTEDMGEYLVIFDMTRVNDIDLKPRSFRDRAECLDIVQDIIRWEELGDQLKVELPFYPKSLGEFQEFIDACARNNEEGVVIRLASAPYEPGRPNSGGNCLKLKFIGEATCVVTGYVEGKRSVTIGIRGMQSEHNGGIIEIGKVTIPPNYHIPEKGDFVEVRYMNIMQGAGAKLFQPRYKGVRTDKTQADMYTSLKFKKE